MSLKYIALGISTYVPWVEKFRAKRSRTGGTDSARYCYSVWLRHLIHAHKNGLLKNYPKVVAELGPGDSIGIGLAALISGVDVYYGLDVVRYAEIDRNMRIFDALVDLFRNRENIPDEREFPNLKPFLDSYEFPRDLLNDKHLAECLRESRVIEIRKSILNVNNDNSKIKYVAPWHDQKIMKKGTLDMLYSQAVLEHVDNLDEVYKNMELWLKKTGFLSHQIDFKCHGLAKEWNGHWSYSDFKWTLIKGRRPYLLNRLPLSKHLEILDKRFRVLGNVIRTETPSKITREKLAPTFRDMSITDLSTSSAFFQAIKKH